MVKQRFRKRRRRNGLSTRVSKNSAFIKDIQKGIERKVHDSEITADSVDTTGANHILNAPPQGTTIGARIGAQANSKRLTIRGYFSNTTGTPVDCIIRMLIYRCRDQNNGNQTLSIVLQDGASNLNSPYHIQHQTRFQILADKTFVMDTSLHSLMPFYFTHKTNVITQYNGSAQTFADIEKNGYWIAFYSDVTAASGNAPTVTFDSRWYFTDA